MKIKIVCPLGGECEKAIDNGTIERCAWFIKIAGKNPQSEETFDKWGCAIGWMPILLIENSQQVKGVGAATESLRNESAKGQQIFNSILLSVAQKQIKSIG